MTARMFGTALIAFNASVLLTLFSAIYLPVLAASLPAGLGIAFSLIWLAFILIISLSDSHRLTAFATACLSIAAGMAVWLA